MIDIAEINKRQREWADKNAERLARKRQMRMLTIDALPAELRCLVHDYGWHVVNTFLQLGVANPKHIKQIVETVLDEFSPTRHSCSSQGISHPREWAET